MRSMARVRRASAGTAKFSGMKSASGPRVDRYSSCAPSASTKNCDGLVEVGHGEGDMVGVADAGDAGQPSAGARGHAGGPAVEARTSSSGVRTT